MDGLAIFDVGRRGGPRNSGATIRNWRSEVLAFIGWSRTKGLRGASGIPLPRNGRYTSMCRINGYKPTYGGLILPDFLVWPSRPIERRIVVASPVPFSEQGKFVQPSED